MAKLREQAHSCLGSACLLSGPGGAGWPFAAVPSTMGGSWRGDLPGPFRASKTGRTSRNQRTPHPGPLKGRGRGPEG